MNDTVNTPRHVAIILDGNRRWAAAHNKPFIEGHRTSALNMKKLTDHLYKKGVHTITLWIFSTENWSREPEQVSGLLQLFQDFMERYFQDALKENGRIVHLGRKDRIPEKLRESIKILEEKTKGNTKRVMNIALDYGGRDEIVRAIKSIPAEELNELTVESFNTYLDTKDQPYPEPDMIIRTGGDMRMSGFMLWQGAYSELFFTETYLPDLQTQELDAMLEEYGNRKRRFGA